MCMCVSTCMFVGMRAHACISTSVCISTYLRVWISMHVFLRVLGCVCRCVFLSRCAQIRTYADAQKLVWASVCMCVCACMCACVRPAASPSTSEDVTTGISLPPVLATSRPVSTPARVWIVRWKFVLRACSMPSCVLIAVRVGMWGVRSGLYRWLLGWEGLIL